MSSDAGLATSRSAARRPPTGRGSEWSALPPLAQRRSVWRWRPTRIAAIALFLGLLVTAAFALISLRLYVTDKQQYLAASREIVPDRPQERVPQPVLRPDTEPDDGHQQGGEHHQQTKDDDG